MQADLVGIIANLLVVQELSCFPQHPKCRRVTDVFVFRAGIVVHTTKDPTGVNRNLNQAFYFFSIIPRPTLF